MLLQLDLESLVYPSYFSRHDFINVSVFIIDLAYFAPVDRGVNFSLVSVVIFFPDLIVKVFSCLRCLLALRRVNTLCAAKLVSLSSVLGTVLFLHRCTCSEEAFHLFRFFFINQFHGRKHLERSVKGTDHRGLGLQD